MVTIDVGGVDVGQITTGANGSGGLVLSSNPQGNQQALPSNFPTNVAAGTSVSATDAVSLSLTGELSALPPAPSGQLLTAQLTGTGTTAMANVQFAQYTAGGTANTMLAVQVQGAPASDTLTVTLAGDVIGEITTDANGNGMLLLASKPQGQQQPLPTNFPTSVAAGAAVSIVDASTLSLTGKLASVPPPPIGSIPPAAPNPNASVLVAKLTGSTATIVGLAQLTQASVAGETYTLFSLQVHGATAADTLTVTLNGVNVGQITTDAKGNGQLVLSSNPQGPQQQPLPSNFPSGLTSGNATVTVTDASTLSLTGAGHT